MRNQMKRTEIPEALKDGALKIMDTWGRGNLTQCAAAVTEHRLLLSRIEEMVKQDLWNMAAGQGANS